MSITLFLYIPHRSATIDQDHVYLLDENNGANNLTITTGHLLDVMMYLFGSFIDISATLRTDSKIVPVIETGKKIIATSPDHLVITGTLENGALFSTHVRNTFNSNFSFEINGSKGDLVLTFQSVSPSKMFQIDPFIILGSQGKGNVLKQLSVPSEYYLAPKNIESIPAYNIAQLYTIIYQDLKDNTHVALSFHTAINIHQLFDEIRLAANTKQTHTLSKKV
ncbi:Gfo/Idh/MocA family oxidoreductase [Shimazuella alba]|nr:Gfo/Idh/MocA family oxidoreductase [Shimazuella alba]